MRKRFHVHSSDLTQLHEQLPSHILPTEYGGSHRDSLESIVRNWTDDLLSKEELFVSMEAYGIKETELTKKSVDDADTMAGLAGTYKKLDT
uniref:Alpha-tocopherol transfer protein-like n=1 Tax=Saccoglossus kowalevskii TaxID=10224 RepID=A0ABM0MCL9_SACKO|nr:PREDICTED: alpha-tocopherol transfer protein-like [Saccoglossus kowalevskii]